MRHLRPVLKPFGGVTVVFVVLGSSLILLNPFQTNFSVYQKALYGKTKNLLKTGFVIDTKYLKIVLHGTVVNGVQGRITGSPSWKYEHRRASALLRNIENIRICMGKRNLSFP